MDETVLQAYTGDDVNIMDDKTILFRLRRLNQKSRMFQTTITYVKRLLTGDIYEEVSFA